MSLTPRLAVIVTALPLERKAVLEHLSSVSEEPPLRGSIYRRGIFDENSGAWDVIVAEIGAGNQGAAAEVERVIAHYSPEVALFVGVAGAIKDMSHGDVVASTKVYGYESGKDEEGGFRTRPAVQLPHYSLEQRARYEAGESHWRQRIRRIGGGVALSVMPEARAAPIAAGEKVVASNRSRTHTFIRKEYGDAVAVEMEGAGFLLSVHMNHPTQGIVVRGISDLVDDKDEANDKVWQPIAARHAAAFAFQILAKHALSAERPTPDACLDPAWQAKHLEDAEATAGPRYSAELRVETPLHDIFEALGHTERWFTSLQARRLELARCQEQFLKGIETDIGLTLANQLQDLGRIFDALVDGSGTPSAVAEALTTILPELRELHISVRSELEKQYGEGAADSAQFRQFHAEYQLTFPAAQVDAVRDLVAALEDLETWARAEPARASESPKGVLLLGGPGVGKTHGICDIAQDRFRRELYTVVLFGEQFTSADEPWERIRQLLGIAATDRDGILEALDTAGAASGWPLLLCIDGLNESRHRGYWRTWLASFATQVARYPNIRLCVSCRSTYEPVSVPEGHGLERIQHVGFLGMEFTACRHFFTHYGLEPPVAPILHQEFSNPLFLRLVCEALQATGAQRMPTGWYGFNTALSAFLREKNRAFAREYGRDERERVPQRALNEFMVEAELARRVYLRWSDADAAIARVRPTGLVGPTVLEWLVRAGLLISDVDPEDSGPDAEEVVRVAFERLGEHLLAARLLDGIEAGEDLHRAIASGSLSFAFADTTAVLENQGLVGAISIQLAEHKRFPTELVDVLPRGGPSDAVLRATISALPWRDPAYMTERTQALLLTGMSTGPADETFDIVLAIATQATASDAIWLHGLLASMSMPDRDGFMCFYLHKRVGAASAVERLLRAPFEVDSADIPEPVCFRWAILLLWFGLAADRRVRDRATKGLVAITQARPTIWAALIEKFARVNDEYIVERCFCAAYGVLLRTRVPSAEQEVATAAYTAVFAESTAVPNALIRDHARCIIELAHHDGVLAAEIDLSRVRPPYESEWPLRIPSEEDVKPYADAHREFPKLYRSCLDDDFFHYTLSDLDPYMTSVRSEEMGRWILQHVISEIGYGGEDLAHYDSYMLHHHGGGRGRPAWAERIGKKYQRIALSRLAARLADNVVPKEQSWGPEVEGVPLVFAGGRDIDPSLLAQSKFERHDEGGGWFPVEYDFAAVKGLTNANWTANADDVPSSEKFLRPLSFREGEWQSLSGQLQWSARTDRDTLARLVRMTIEGYLVKKESLDTVFQWIASQNFMDHRMPDGAQFHGGYVGEYPWGILFKMYPDEWYSTGSNNDTPALLTPVCNSITSSYDEDAYQGGAITVHVPARIFFEGEDKLRWDGLSGYCDEERRLRFLDPSATQSGPPALLVDRSFLLDFLRRHDLAVVWSVLGEKIAMSVGAGASARLEFTQAHMLDQSGVLHSSGRLTLVR